MTSIYYNRLKETDPELYDQFRALDPNGRAPLTAEERGTLTAEQRDLLEQYLARANRALITRQGPRIELSGRTVAATAVHGLGRGDTREHTPISTTVSRANFVEPLFPRSICEEPQENFSARLQQLLLGARRFIFVVGYELDREDLVETLIAKARQGVQVVVLFDPADESSRQRTKSELLDRLRDVARSDPLIRKLGNLHVAEYERVVPSLRQDAEPILHVKKVIADLPDGSIAEVSGGINFSNTSVFHFDTAMYTEGVAVLDSLNRAVEAFPGYPNNAPFDLSRVPSATEVRRIVQSKASRRRKMTAVEIAGSGRRHVETPRSLSLTQLRQRAKAGQKIVVSAKDALRPGCADVLVTALQNNAWVKIIDQGLSCEEQDAFDRLAPKLRALGAAVLGDKTVLREESYARLVYRELDRSIADRESIDVAAFCLTDTGVLDRLVLAKQAGCAVRVLVDDLTIDKTLINRKAMAILTRAGIDVRVFDDRMAERLAHPGMAVPSNTKLHAKVMVLGAKRVLCGSANFTRNGFKNNVEDGRLVSSPRAAQTLLKKLYDPLWSAASSVESVREVEEARRVRITAPVPMNTPVSDLVFVVFDLETTGLAPQHDDRILSIGAQAIKVRPDGTVETLDAFNQFVTPGRDPMGKPFEIPTAASRINGLTAEQLRALDARGIREVLPDFVRFVERQAAHGQVVMAGQNVAFDLRFLDHTLSRELLGFLRGGRHGKLDAPFVDTLALSKRLYPNDKRHNLDAVAARLGVAQQHRGVHDAYEDVGLTSRVLARLVKLGGAKVLADLMGPDRLRVEEPLPVRVPGHRAPQLELFRPHAGAPYVRTMGASASNDKPTKVTGLQVLGVKGDEVEVAITTGSGDESETVIGYLPPEELVFVDPGRVFFELRERGHALPRAVSLTAVRPTRAVASK